MAFSWKSFSMSAIALAAALLALTACGDSGGPGGFDIVEQPLQGVIEGSDFVLASGYAEDSYFSPGEKYDVDLYNILPAAGLDPWSLGAYPYNASYLKVMFSVPQTAGTYPLYIDWGTGTSQTVTLYDTVTDMNTVCDEGTIRIDLVSGGYITGAVSARMSNDHSSWVNGTFTIQIKPE